MASTINASTSPAAIVQTADGTGILALQTAGTTAVTIDASQRAAFVAGTAALPAITTTGDTNTGMWFPAADTIAFSEGGAEAVRIDSSGNVGIGTATPVRMLDVSKTTGDAGVAITSSTTGQSSIFFADTDTNVGMIYYEHTNDAMGFRTNDAERMRIDSSGVLLVNTTSYNASVSSSGKFQVQNSATEWCGAFQNNNAGTAYGLYVRYYSAAPNSTGSEFVYCQDSSGVKASIRSNGGLANYSANNSNLSDQREKTNIELAGSYLDKVCAIPVKTFNYIDQNMEEDGGLTLGVIAQDVQAVAPELIMESNWAGKDEPEKLRLSIYQTDLQYALMKCIQEQQALITSLTARITALEGA